MTSIKFLDAVENISVRSVTSFAIDEDEAEVLMAQVLRFIGPIVVLGICQESHLLNQSKMLGSDGEGANIQGCRWRVL